jgi:hypothetical protein
MLANIVLFAYIVVLNKFSVGALQLGTIRRPVARVSAGPLTISQLGVGTWSWGNRLLWDYDPTQDEEIFQAYTFARDSGVTIFDTADSYGTLDLNGRAEILLGQFERRYQAEIQSKPKNLWWDFKKPTVNNNAQQVATKLAPYPWRITRGSVVQAAKESLQRLEQTKLLPLRSSTGRLPIISLYKKELSGKEWLMYMIWVSVRLLESQITVRNDFKRLRRE